MKHFIYPLKGEYRITSKFGYRDIGRGRELHQGLDICDKVAGKKVPVYASADGKVIRVGALGTYGNVVMIQHNINGKRMDTNYAHLDSYTVKVGDTVKQGQQIGISGNTGGSFGVHLHFEIHNGAWATGQPNAVDPLLYLDKDLSPTPTNSSTQKHIIDVSHHQGDIDWVKASKEVSLAVIRTQYGTSTIDRNYIQNINGCKQNNIPFGVYIYVTYKNKAEALNQAKDFYNRAKPFNPLFYVVDVEEQTCSSVESLIESTQTFINYLKSQGVKVGFYTGHHFYKPYKMDTINNYDFLWIPRYGTTKPNFKCDIWQYTDKGKINGIKGNVDMNVLNGDKDLKWFTSKTTTPSNVNTVNKGDDDLKFSSPTLEKEYETSINSAARRKIIVETAIKGGASTTWLTKLNNKTITEGDIVGLAIKYIVDNNK